MLLILWQNISELLQHNLVDLLLPVSVHFASELLWNMVKVAVTSKKFFNFTLMQLDLGYVSTCKTTPEGDPFILRSIFVCKVLSLGELGGALLDLRIAKFLFLDW
jgi:hypothetical protein